MRTSAPAMRTLPPTTWTGGLRYVASCGSVERSRAATGRVRRRSVHTGVHPMATIQHVTIEADDPIAAQEFHARAFGELPWLRVRQGDAPSDGFRGFTLSLVVAQLSTVDALVDSAVEAGATPVKPASRSLWGYGGAVRAPDGTVWTVASASKKETGDAGSTTRQVDDVVLQLGVEDVAASKEFYVGQGVPVAKSYGRRYVELDTGRSPVDLALYRRRALAKVAGVPADGTGSHRLTITGDAGTFTDPDGFVWEPVQEAP